MQHAAPLPHLKKPFSRSKIWSMGHTKGSGKLAPGMRPEGAEGLGGVAGGRGWGGKSGAGTGNGRVGGAAPAVRIPRPYLAPQPPARVGSRDAHMSTQTVPR